MRRVAILSSAVAVLVSSSVVFAVDRLVPGQYPTIQAGIDAAVEGDTVIVGQDTYYENIDFGGKSITVTSTDPNEPAATVIDAGGSGTVVTFPNAAGASWVLAGFTITNGWSSSAGGVFCENGTISINNCIITGNSAEGAGGILNFFCNLVVTGCTFSENFSLFASGGGIYSTDGELTLTDCTFIGNSAAFEGGGVATDYERVTLTNCTFIGNSAKWGGGMNNSHWGATATNCIFIGNSAEKGGGICNFELRHGDKTLRLNNCTFSGNVADNYGGAVCNQWGGNLMLTDCITWGNSANEGPQIAFEGGGTVSASHSCLQGGQWDIYVPGGTLNWLDGNIEDDPRFVTGPVGDYYLSQIVAGQGSNSPCVDAGSDTATNLGMNVLTTRTDEVSDVGTVDMGYHYPAGTLSGRPDINLDLHVDSSDYCILAAYWRQCNEPCDANYLPGDIIKDHCVDANDLKVLVFSWLDCYVGTASTPSPPNSPTGADPSLMLMWSPGYGSLLHDVYLGTDGNAVAEADHLMAEYMGTVSGASFDPCGLELDTAYFWRVDEVGPACIAPGAVWSFATWGEPNSHLVGWWKFDEGAGGTANDSAGSNHGTVYGPNWTSGQINGALSFDGTQDYVDVPDNPSLRFSQNDSFSISFWAYPVSTGYVLSKMRASNCSSGIFGYQVNWTASKFQLVIDKSCAASVAVGTADDSAPSGSWYHVTCLYDNKDMEIYLNGQFQDSRTFDLNTGSTTPDKNLAIGARSYDSTITAHFGGSIDDMRIYNRALTDEEILELYEGGLN